MTKYLQRGDTYLLTNDGNLIVEDVLPVGTYTVGFNGFTNEFFLKQIASYDSKNNGKMYGDIVERANRIFNTFKEREGRGTGVLLSGEKGTGKTLLAKLLSQIAGSEGIPTIVINEDHAGEIFNRFIQSIEQPCVILFDEFEKIYHGKTPENASQEALLTLLDGVYPSHKLFVLTTNDRYGINRHMLNRPGRLFYHIEYRGLAEEFVREYCADALHDKTQTEGVAKVASFFEDFNFDMLKSLVEEMNRYKESAQSAMALMNIKVDSRLTDFDATVYYKGKKVRDAEEGVVRIDPMKPFPFSYYQTAKARTQGNAEYVSFDPSNIIKMGDGNFTFKRGDVLVEFVKKTRTEISPFTIFASQSDF